MTAPRLTELRANAFRGFAAPCRIPLDADVVLVRGDNGSGKTSMIDALLWALTGKLPLLEERLRGQRKQIDPILNLYSEGETPTVAIDIVAGATRWTLERSGGLRNNELTVYRTGEDPGSGSDDISQVFGIRDPEDFGEAVRTWGILRQDAMRTAIEDGGPALHQRMASVLGLERIATFAKEARRLCSEATRRATELDREIAQLTERYEDAKQKAMAAQVQATSGDAGAGIIPELTGTIALLPKPLGADISGASALTAISTIGREVGSLIDAVTVVITRREELAALGREPDPSPAAHELVADANAAVLRATEAVPATAALAQQALPLLSDYCPVCAQAIDRLHVTEHLEGIIEQAATAQARLAEARAKLAAAQGLLAVATATRQQLQRAEEAVELAEQELAETSARLALLAGPEGWWQHADLVGILDTLRAVREALRALYAHARSSLGGDSARLESTVEAIGLELESKRAEQVSHRAKLAQATELDRASQQAADRIMARALERLQPSFAEVFDRLAPHPTFTELRAKQDIYFKKNQVVPEVVDPLAGVAANPALVYSEGQLNVVALSYFLGLALNARDGALPFLVLDDPLQAMDVVSVLGFADLARRLRENRQLIITTHDRRFADVLARKLRPRDHEHRTLVVELEAWSREGPHVGWSYAEPAVIPMLLHGAA